MMLLHTTNNQPFQPEVHVRILGARGFGGSLQMDADVALVSRLQRLCRESIYVPTNVGFTAGSFKNLQCRL